MYKPEDACPISSDGNSSNYFLNSINYKMLFVSEPGLGPFHFSDGSKGRLGFVKAEEEAEIMLKLELNVWLLFWKPVALYKIPALSLFLAVIAALGKLRNDALLNI